MYVQVYFITDAALDRDGFPRRAATQACRANYSQEPVATMACPAERDVMVACESAWSATQNVTEPWHDPPRRSMMVGDVAVVDGAPFMAGPIGFVPTQWV